MKTLIDIFNSGGHFLLILLGIGAVCWILEKILEMFRKKKGIKRHYYGICGAHSLTEQEYVDREFDRLKDGLDSLKEEIEILKNLYPIEHEFITDQTGYYEGDKYFGGDNARKRLKEKGYSYVKSFKIKGELWVKEDKNK